MKEFVTEALVLDYQSFSNKDRRVDLLTKNLGRLKARVVSGAKPTSKLSLHLDPLNLTTVRLIQKNRFTVADSFTKTRFDNIRDDVKLTSKALNVVALIRSVFPELVPDLKLWHTLQKSLEDSSINPNYFMKILGYDPELASCYKCKDKKPRYFITIDQYFVCKSCSDNIPNNILIRTNYA